MTPTTSRIRFFSQILLLTASSLIIASCGGGKSLPKLTDAQKSALSQTIESAGNVRSGVPADNALPAQPPLPSVPAMGWATGLVSTSRPSAEPASLEVGRIQDRLNRERAANHCAINAQQSEVTAGSADSMSFPKINIQVSGDSCPVSLSLQLEPHFDSQSFDLKLSCAFSVRDPSFSQLNDVDAMDLSGSMHVSGTPGSKFEGTTDIHGTIHSQKNGAVRLAVTGTMSGEASVRSSSAKTETIARLDFPTFSVEMKAVTNGNSHHFWINDEEVTEQDFTLYFAKAGMSASPGASHSVPIEH